MRGNTRFFIHIPVWAQFAGQLCIYHTLIYRVILEISKNSPYGYARFGNGSQRIRKHLQIQWDKDWITCVVNSSQGKVMEFNSAACYDIGGDTSLDGVEVLSILV